MPVTLNKPVDKVQTGGFGDPNGLHPTDSKATARLVSAQMGSFDMPMGPGQGNGSGGAKGAKGTVASAGFGQGSDQAVDLSVQRVDRPSLYTNNPAVLLRSGGNRSSSARDKK